MKRIFLFLIATSALLTSCGSDDSDGAKRPDMVTIQGGNESYVYTMTYDNKGRLSTLGSNYAEAHTFQFQYGSNGKVSSVTSTGATPLSFSFTYDSSNKMTSYTRSGDTFPITWANDQTLTIDGTTITLDNNGDLMGYSTLMFTRDSGKGAFASVKGVDALTMLLVEQPTLYFAGKKPIKSLGASGTSIVFANDLEGGYLASSMFALDGISYTMNVTY